MTAKLKSQLRSGNTIHNENRLICKNGAVKWISIKAQLLSLIHIYIFLPREDAEIAAAVLENLDARGLQVLRGIQVQKIRDREDGADLTVRTLSLIHI